jgi:hypothetical protein
MGDVALRLGADVLFLPCVSGNAFSSFQRELPVEKSQKTPYGQSVIEWRGERRRCMPKTLMLALAFLLMTTWVVAQTQSPQTGSSRSSTESSGHTTVQGCLHESNGSYSLTSDSGMTYQLEGDGSTLSKHVGHEVRITGMSSGGASSGSATSSNMGTSGTSQEALTVKSVKHISTTCSKEK